MKNLVIKGNSKMGKEVGIFNLPPKKTCTPTRWCLKGKNGKPSCYALRNNYILPSVRASLQKRFNASKRKDFVDKISSEINNSKYKYFRIHSSGDFYSSEYVQKWIDIVRRCPGTLFRSTTRRRDLKKYIKQLSDLKNIIIRESLDTEINIPSMGLKFTALSHCKYPRRKNIIECKNNCVECQYLCWVNHSDVVYDEH